LRHPADGGVRRPAAGQSRRGRRPLYRRSRIRVGPHHQTGQRRWHLDGGSGDGRARPSRLAEAGRARSAQRVRATHPAQPPAGGDPYANFISNHVPWDWSLSSGYLYPPAFAVTLIPLTWVGNDLAVRIWLFVIQAAVLASLVIVYRVIGAPRRAELLAVVAVLTTFSPLANSVYAGAMNSLLLLLLAGGWACWQRRQDLAGGVLVGTAAIFK